MTGIDIRNFTRGQTPRLPFTEVAASVLPGWEISLVLAGKTRAQSLNRTLRAKSYVPNVLSYELGRKHGEVILCPEVSRAEAAAYDHTPNQHLLFLFIHGLLHLKGLRHGATMDKRERDILARFLNVLPTSSNGTTHRNRHRYRNASNEGRRR